MCIIDMTEIRSEKKKNKRLSWSTNEQVFLNSMNFNSEKEKEECLKYLKLKGIAYHVILANYIGFDQNGKINYEKIAVFYKYDKRIRNILYKFLSAFEERVRAFISNKYSNNMARIKWYPKMKKNMKEGSSLATELENLFLSQLLNLSKKLPILDQKELYGNIEYLDNNLKALQELRNAVSHHRMLFVYDKFEPCFINGKEEDDLVANLKNLYNLLDSDYQQYFKEAINNSCVDKKNPNFKKMLPKKAILII